jgi:hypothetical protein
MRKNWPQDDNVARRSDIMKIEVIRQGQNERKERARIKIFEIIIFSPANLRTTCILSVAT